MDRKTGHNCAARGCKNRRYHTGKESFFSLPKDIPRARTWIIASGREDLLQDLENLHSSYRLCGAHFEKNAFQNNLRNRLHKHAVPTIFPAMEGTSTAFDHTYSAFVPNQQYFQPWKEHLQHSIIPTVHLSQLQFVQVQLLYIKQMSRRFNLNLEQDREEALKLLDSISSD
ncbi:THAP domain [Popillia japonica]|uniref:THAP domain n=1 Tax=Popillia japonica TaxID=7064 RepID=A0AAW1KJY4_POPJA